MAAPAGDAAAALSQRATLGAARGAAGVRQGRDGAALARPPKGSLDSWLGKRGTISEARGAGPELLGSAAGAGAPPDDALEEAWAEGDASGFMRLDVQELNGATAFDCQAAAGALQLPKLNLAGTAARQRQGQAGPQRAAEGLDNAGGGGDSDSDSDPPPQVPKRRKGWAAVIDGRRAYFAGEAAPSKAALVRFASNVAQYHDKARLAEQAAMQEALVRASQELHPCFLYGVPAPSVGAPQGSGAACAASQQRRGSHTRVLVRRCGGRCRAAGHAAAQAHPQRGEAHGVQLGGRFRDGPADVSLRHLQHGYLPAR